MPSLEELHILPSIAQALDRRGWTAESPGVKDITPTAARGHNLVAVSPPAPVYTTPAMAGLLSRMATGRQALVIAPAVQLEEWGSLVYELALNSGLRVQVARGTARAMRQLRTDGLEVIVAALDTALSLLTRSALRMDTVDALFLAWPELLPDKDAMVPLMQDLPRDAQRIIYTSDSGGVNALVERYARKALTVAPPKPDTAAATQTVRTVSSSWSGRPRAVAEVIELLDPVSLVIWTADRSHHDQIRRAVPESQPGVQLVQGDAPEADTILAFDLPTAERLAQLLGAGEVVLLVPPGTERYAAQLTSRLRPLHLPGAVDAARSAEQMQRSTIQAAIEEAELSRPLLTLAPLFERYDATMVAAALFELWQKSEKPRAPAEQPETGGTARVFVGSGKKDGVTANDLVAVLTKELKVERTKIGRIELRDGYSLIELPAHDAELIAARLNGATVRRKRVTARVDRGPTRPGRGDGEPRRPTRRANGR